MSPRHLSTTDEKKVAGSKSQINLLVFWTFRKLEKGGRREPGSIHGEVELVPDYLGGRRDVLQYELEQLDQEQHTAIGTLGEGSLGHLLG